MLNIARPSRLVRATEHIAEMAAFIGKLVERGFEKDVVARIERLLYIAEYKRRQAPPGVKIGIRNFGRDRRYPIVNRWRDPS